MHCVICGITLECFHVVAHNYIASFSLKTYFYEKQTTLREPISFSWTAQFLATLYCFYIVLTKFKHTLFRKCTIASQCRPKFTFLRQRSKKYWPFETFKKILFLAMFFFTYVKMLFKLFQWFSSKRDHPSQNYGLLNFLFRCTDSYKCHPN